MDLLDDDDDDDDLDLLNMPLKKKPSRAETKKREREKSFLQDLLKDQDRHMKKTVTLHQVKREHNDENNASANLQDLKAKVAVLAEAKNNRQETQDRLKGLVQLYADQALPRDELLARVQALETDGSILLGERRMIVWTGDTTSLATSYTEAIQELKQIVQQLSKTAPTGADSLVSTLCQRLLLAIHMDVVEELLSERRISRLLSKIQGAVCPEEVTLWLYRVATCASLGCRRLHALGTQAVNELIAIHALSKHDNDESLSGLYDSLPNWLNENGLPWEEDEQQSAKPPVYRNIMGLRNFLQFWTSVIPRCQAPPCPDTARQCIVALTRLSLDEHISSRTFTVGLGEVVQSTQLALMNRMVAASSNDEAALQTWLESTVQAVFANLAKLGPGKPDSADEDDVQAQFVYGRILRALPAVNGGAVHPQWLQFKALGCVTTLQHLLGLDKSFVEQALRRGSKKHADLLLQAQQESPWWYTIASALAALQATQRRPPRVPKEGKTQQEEDSPVRLLAIIDCAVLAFQTGFIGLSTTTSIAVAKDGNKDVTELHEYGSPEDAKIAVCYLELFQSATQDISRCIQNLDHPHFQRADYLLHVFHQYLGAAVKWASKQANMDTKDKIQKDVRRFFLTSP